MSEGIRHLETGLFNVNSLMSIFQANAEPQNMSRPVLVECLAGEHVSRSVTVFS